MTTHAYLFEAKSIQNYILDSGRMRDLIGASELVDSLTEQLLDDALLALQYQPEDPIRFSRRAGGALYAFSTQRDKLDRFAALWSLLVAQYAPGLTFDVGRSTGECADAASAFDSARDDLRQNASRVRNTLPVTAPIVERSRRTGNAGCKRERDRDTRCKSAIDLPTVRKRKYNTTAKDGRVPTGLLRRFSPEGCLLGAEDWPRDLTPGAEGAFPYLGDDHTIALIHADGNGMGEMLRRAGEKAKGDKDRFITIFRGLSEAIAHVTQAAAQHATRTVLIDERDKRRDNPDHPEPQAVLAARPMVLGGDDLTILVRADLALPFLGAFLKKFEDESGPRLAPLNLGIRGLTAGAGVVFLRASQPFYLAATLAESLAKLAKDRGKAQHAAQPPSTLAFHRATQSLIEDYPAIVDREKTVSIDDTNYVNTLGAYALRKDQKIPCLDDLFQLTDLLQGEDMSRGPTRQLQTLMGLAPTQAETAYRRWRELMKDNRKARLEVFDSAMSALLPAYDKAAKLPYAASDEGVRVTPLGDALTLLNVTKHRTNDTDQEVAA